MIYLVLVLLLVTAGVAPYLGQPGAFALVIVSLLWLPLNVSVEGRTLVAVTPQNGFTQADLLSLVGFALAGLILVMSARE